MGLTTKIGNFTIITSVVQVQRTYMTIVMRDNFLWDTVSSATAEDAEDAHDEMVFAAEAFIELETRYPNPDDTFTYDTSFGKPDKKGFLN